MTKAQVNPAMLRWARERVGLPPGELARRIGIRADAQHAARIISKMESDEQRPTFRQAERWAAATHVPFGHLYLDAPPEDEPPIADQRRMADGSEAPLSADFSDLIHDVPYRHAWYRKYLQEIAAPEPDFAGVADRGMPVDAIARDIRERTGLVCLPGGRDEAKLQT